MRPDPTGPQDPFGWGGRRPTPILDRISTHLGSTDTSAPLVVTLALPDDVQGELDALRRRWFPSGRTAVAAHLTLFHAVPGHLGPRVGDDLARVAADGPVAVRLSHVISLGRGAAYAVESADLRRRHGELQAAWWPHLTRQDRQPLRAHVTLQNKVEPSVARATVDALRSGFTPRDVAAPGFDLWRYEGGPWRHLERFAVERG